MYIETVSLLINIITAPKAFTSSKKKKKIIDKLERTRVTTQSVTVAAPPPSSSHQKQRNETTQKILSTIHILACSCACVCVSSSSTVRKFIDFCSALATVRCWDDFLAPFPFFLVLLSSDCMPLLHLFSICLISSAFLRLSLFLSDEPGFDVVDVGHESEPEQRFC